MLTILPALLLLGPGMPGGTLSAQAGCHTIDPPCDPPPAFTIDLSIAGGDTVRTATPTASAYVQGIPGANAAGNGASLSITTAAFVSLQFEANGQSASGSGTLALSPGANSITATYCDNGSGCRSTTRSVFYIAPPPPVTQGPPLVTQEPGSPYRRSLGDCAGCAYTTLSYSTPAYHSLDRDRSLTLLYSSATSAPMGTVVLDVNANSTTPPDRISVSLILPNNDPVQLSNGRHEIFYAGGSGTSRLTAQFDATTSASTSPSGLHSMIAIVRNWWGSTMLETRLPIQVMVVNERRSGFGSGWSVAGLQQLKLPQGEFGPAMFIESNRVIVFPNCGQGCWTPPPGEGSTFYWQTNGRLQRRYVDGSIAEFDPNARILLLTRDRFGLQTSFQYDGYQRLTRVTDPAGFVTTIDWTGAPGSSSTAIITTPGGRTSRIQTDGAGQLVNIVDPDYVQALAVGYTNNRISSVTNRIGGTTDFSYDVHGGLASITGPFTDTQDRGWSRSTTTVQSREAALLPLPGTGAPGQAVGRRVLLTDVWLATRSQRGDSTRIASNGAGDATAIVTRNPQGKLESTVITYNDAGQPRTVTSTSGTSVQYGWAGAQLSSVRDLASGVTTEFAYNGFGQNTVTWVEGTVRQQNFYSADGRSVLDSSTSGDATTRFTYDGVGRVLTIRDGEQHQASFSYQASGYLNLANSTRNWKTTQFAYDGYGRPRTVTDPAYRSQTTSYDLLNRVSSVLAPDQSTSSWGFDDVNRHYTFTDARGQLYRSVLDAAGASRFEYDAAGRTASLRYDSDGSVVSRTSKGGRTVDLTRDVMGRVTQVSAGGLVTTMGYDTASKWVTYANAESIDTVFVDGKGRVSKQVTVRNGTPFTMVTEYGDVGTRQSLSMTSPAWSGGRGLSFGVDNLGRPDMLTDPSGRGTSITYNKDHQPKTVTLPTGSATSRLKQTLSYGTNDLTQSITSTVAPWYLNWNFAYDQLDRLQVIETGLAGDNAQRTVGYDVMGRLNQWTDKSISQTQEWVCDGSQLYADDGSCYWEYYQTETTLRQAAYNYDAVGNRTDGGAATTTGNRLLGIDGYSMSYDADGNVVSKVGNGISQSFTWNALGQLTSVTSNGSTTTFGYDGLGRRVRKTPPSGLPEIYLYDGLNLAVQVNYAMQPIREYSYYPGIDHPHAVRNSGTGEVFYYMTNGAASVTALVSLSNQVVNRYEYTPFGQLISEYEQISQPFRFTAREFDSETGLYYNRARYYDPAIARFISEDPIGLAGGVNTYAYVGNDPVNNVDPSGLDCFSIVQRIRGDVVCSGGQCSETPGYDQRITICTGGGSGTPGSSGVGPGPSGPGAGGGGGSGTGVVDKVGAFLTNSCTVASAAVAVDFLGGVATVAGGLQVRAAFTAVNVASAALSRAAFYATVNGGRSSARRMTTASLAYLGAREATNPALGAFGMSYASGVIDDAFRGASWEAFVPFLGLLSSVPKAAAACR